MRYRKKMILLYAVMVLILALVVGTVYYNYNTARVREREQQTLEFYAQEIMQQFDSSVKMMEYAIGSLVYSKSLFGMFGGEESSVIL